MSQICQILAKIHWLVEATLNSEGQGDTKYLKLLFSVRFLIWGLLFPLVSPCEGVGPWKL